MQCSKQLTCYVTIVELAEMATITIYSLSSIFSRQLTTSLNDGLAVGLSAQQASMTVAYVAGQLSGTGGLSPLSTASATA